MKYISSAHQEFCATPDMPMALPSGYENVVCHVTSDHHADQNFEPDLATHEATVSLIQLLYW